MEPRVRPRIGLLPLGHHYYWDQFPLLKPMGQRMYDRLVNMLAAYGEVVTPELVDTPEKSRAAGRMLRQEAVDLLVIFPFGYTTAMNMIPAVM